MEVRFTAEQEKQLSQIATQASTAPERLVNDAVLRLLEDDTRFNAPRARASNRPTEASSSRKRRRTLD
jgi:hypothetical protein